MPCASPVTPGLMTAPQACRFGVVPARFTRQYLRLRPPGLW